MKIKFREPPSCRYLYVDPDSNRVHLFMPVVGGTDIATDNTCQTLNRIKTFWGHIVGSSAEDELSRYQGFLRFDLSLLPEIPEEGSEEARIKREKMERLDQITRIIDQIRILKSKREVGELNSAAYSRSFPSFVQPLQREASNNLFGVRLCPTVQDSFLHTDERALVFSLNRESTPNSFYTKLREAFLGSASLRITPSQEDPSAMLLQAVCGKLGINKTTEVNFSTIKPVILKCVGQLFDQEVPNLADLAETTITGPLMMDEGDALPASEYLNMIFASAAASFFDELPGSPFASVDNTSQGKERLSILIQFFLAEANLFCKFNSLSEVNFGSVLDRDPEIQNRIVEAVTRALAEGGAVEDALLGVINQMRGRFGLSAPLDEGQQSAIKTKFSRHWKIIKDSPHFDEFMFLDVNKPGPFVTHQASICVDIERVINQLIPGTNNQQLLASQELTDRLREIPNINRSITADYEAPNNEIASKLIDLMRETENFHAIVTLLFSAAAEESTEATPDTKIFNFFTPEQITAITSSPNWRELRRYVSANVSNQSELNAFNDVMSAGAIVELRLEPKLIQALHIAAILNVEPSTIKSDYLTNPYAFKVVLDILGVEVSPEDIEPHRDGGFVITCNREEAYYLQSEILPYYRDKLYVNPNTARNIYTIVDKSTKDIPALRERYDRADKELNNAGDRPEKMLEMLNILNIHVDNIFYPNSGVSTNGYIFQASENSFELLSQVMQQGEHFVITPEMASLLYQLASISPSFIANSQHYNNEIRPDLINFAILQLQLPIRNVTFNGEDGYLASAPLALQRVLKEFQQAVTQREESGELQRNTREELSAEEKKKRADQLWDIFPVLQRETKDDYFRQDTEADGMIKFLGWRKLLGQGGGSSAKARRAFMVPDRISMPIAGVGGGRERTTRAIPIDAVGGGGASGTAAPPRTGRRGRGQAALLTEAVMSPFQMERVQASQDKLPLLARNNIDLRCSNEVLTVFRGIIAESPQLLGHTYRNPYNQQLERFPDTVAGFTPRHLQIIARNEAVNTTGVINFDLYGGSLSHDAVAKIRCLVKGTTVSGVLQPSHSGGYPNMASRRPIPLAETIIVDQAGLQWQGDFRNTGGMFFYPTAEHPLLGSHYEEPYLNWQQRMFMTLYGLERSEVCSQNAIEVNWHGVPGRLDLDQMAMAIQSEYREALNAVVLQTRELHDQVTPINFKYLEAGMGFFASGLGLSSRPNELARLKLARLEGIYHALLAIEQSSNPAQILGRISRLELPFTELPNGASDEHRSIFDERVHQIQNICQRLGLTWGGMQREDALAPRDGYINATTNCGDPHAMIGNEGGFESVDAAIATNTPAIQQLNAGFNKNIRLVTAERYIPRRNLTVGSDYAAGGAGIAVPTGGGPATGAAATVDAPVRGERARRGAAVAGSASSAHAFFSPGDHRGGGRHADEKTRLLELIRSLKGDNKLRWTRGGGFKTLADAYAWRGMKPPLRIDISELKMGYDRDQEIYYITNNIGTLRIDFNLTQNSVEVTTPAECSIEDKETLIRDLSQLLCPAGAPRPQP